MDGGMNIRMRKKDWLILGGKLATRIVKDTDKGISQDKDGKKFVRRENFGKLTSAEKSKSYTLSDSDVVDMAHQSAKAYINSELNANEEKLRKSGYVKSQAVPSHDVAPSPKQAKPAPRQGHNVVSESQSSEKPNPVLSALGL